MTTIQYERPWQIVGHDWAVEQMQRAFKNDRVRHAYLIQGPQAIGKTTFAKILAQTLNCTSDNRPCGECRACRLIMDEKHPDLHIIEAERVGGTLKIDQVRELQKKLSMRPFEGRFRVAILRRFNEAQAAAQNAILKTLEEPLGNVVLCLTVEEPTAILPTIFSRCQILNLRPLALAETQNALQHRWDISEERALALAHLSGGRIGWAVRCVQDEDELQFRQDVIDVLEEALKSDRVHRFKLAENLSKDRSQALMMLDFWQTYWRDVLLLAAQSQAPLVNIDREPAILTLAQNIGQDTAQESLEATRTASYQLLRNANPRLCLEVLMLNYPFRR